MSPEELRAIPDPVQRVEAAIETIKAAKALIAEVEVIRNLGLNHLRYQDGVTLRELAARFEMSKTVIATVTG